MPMVNSKIDPTPILNTVTTRGVRFPLLFTFLPSTADPALAFTIWNHTLRTLTAMESSIINGTMLIQIAALAWIFLGEDISFKEIIGMLIASSGAVLVQLKFKR